MVKGQRFQIEDDALLTHEIMSDIEETRYMCKANFNGQLELAFLPCAGGLYDQPAPVMDRIFFIIKALNDAIAQKQEDEKIDKEKKR